MWRKASRSRRSTVPSCFMLFANIKENTMRAEPAVARNAWQLCSVWAQCGAGCNPGQTTGNVGIDLLAPISGTVLIKKAFRASISRRENPSSKWATFRVFGFHAEVYERDLPDIRIGQKAALTTPTVARPPNSRGPLPSSTRTSMRTRAATRSASKWTIPGGWRRTRPAAYPPSSCLAGRDRSQLGEVLSESGIRCAARRQALGCLCGKVSRSVNSEPSRPGELAMR